MMTSVVTDAARGNRDRALPQTTHTSQPQKQIQATAEQIRLAQMIYDKNDADFEGKVQQLMEVTGKNQDECMVALHDCNGDVNRAINFLLEEVTVKDSWETVGKKKNVGKEGTAPESREKRGEKEGRGRGGPNRRGRGASHNQEGRSEENGFDSAPGERGDRGRRGRGRGVGSRGRGRGAGMNRFSQGMGRTFNPADCTGSAEAGEAGNETTEGAGAWKDSLEDWAAEDWNEDLSETKVFTASYALGSKNLAQPGQGMDLGSLLSKVAEGDSELAGLEPSCPDTLTQSLVFTNSQQHTTRTHTHSYASAAAGTYAHAASSMLGSRLPQSDVQKMEPISIPRIAPLSNQVSGALSNGTASVESTAPVPLETTPVTLSEPKETPITTIHLDLKPQPDPSPILGRLTQHQNAALQSDLPAQARDPAPLPPHDGPSPTLKPFCEPVITTTEPPQPRTIRPQRRRAPPPSKIPSSAVEMPGSADVSGLNVQFGALDFGSESSVENLDQSESSCQEPVAAPQTQSSLYFKSTVISESLGGLPQAVMESSYPSASLVLPSTTAPPVLAPSSASRVESSATTPLSNGFSEMRTSSAQEAAPSSTPQPVSTALSTENGLSSLSLSSSSSSTAAPVLSTALPSPSSHVSSVNSPGSSAPTSSSMSTQMGADVNVSLSTYSGSVSSVSSSTVNSNGLSAANQSLTANGASAPSAVRSAPLQTNITLSNTSGKAPPNLAQGVPPLLASQYIMGPGGLLPAYPPIYGYEDLQMMQSRLPMDYYGMTYPGTALAGRDGGLANNPYTGEPTKFGRSDSNSPAPATSLSSVPPSQSQQSAVPPHNQGPQNPGQAQQGQTQAFLNPTLPPGYGYTSLPYYPGVPGMPSAFQYGPTVFMPPASTKQHSMGPSSQYQHQAGYSQHMYGPGYDELSQAHAGGDYGKGGYGGSSQSQAKAVSNSSGKAPGLPGSASSELTGTVYSKTQSFDKQGFPTAAGPAFSLPSALGGTGPLNPAGAPGYAPAPFLHILPHQQPPSQLLHHHMAQDTQGQRSQANSMQKGQGKSNYSSSPYWAN
ncbi:ubiquitin-associated protein 2b isoform X1 [Sinocyclocheilus grahami]|uniref:ubiquitin-associated protein 2b isoform X1 n=1 Tax=Sinocyclocheilus grahami TaxID=75366 RepID=UPI0007AC807A|nr:PREDICTED: ubiquitin-associated protein 2-like isoform X1 [Sinocyclocheilus grahami]XP_016105804.1 PREDICTED: ubiquitin-associated protein 2-like isoform X1 [Sinocyclocheilus grahami]XP_016105805.1 PREDICTED: ubiquitin-associated protein 2-like isoform X2 [Sinocyclocheilus grahami]XP_016105806.1 PREDICTED: ubiquitin-associated protein 2-like isoform X2 [Sinocyclocheilus grahami]XP_016105807.1 PREDICTED: ubiquitin-associated protein 2-like isoform X1 [Sinocyclocheilus grahami]